MPTFENLAQQALEHAKTLDAWLAAQNPPSQQDSLEKLPPDLASAKDDLINVAQNIKQLAQGPIDLMTEITWACADEISLGVIYDYQLAKCVPLESTASYKEISQASGLDQDLVERVLRHAMFSHIFTEDALGHVAHTPTSRLLATNPGMNDALGVMLRETRPACGKAHEAIRLYRRSHEPGDAAFGLAHGEPEIPAFKILSKFPDRVRRFEGAMKYWGESGGLNIEYVIRGYDWAALDFQGSTFVDVGGGQGSVARFLAERTTNMRFVVQDLAENVANGQSNLSESLNSRISFMEHSFFDPQPVEGAEVYFFRWILHDWSDEYAMRILRNLIPALKDGARVIAYEWLLADGFETKWTEKQARNADLVMFAQFNARERSAEAFKALFRRCDARFEVKYIGAPQGSRMAIIESIWKS